MYALPLLQRQAYNEALGRLEKLFLKSQALWGNMDVAQMLARVTRNLEMAKIDEKVTQTLLGRIFGRVVKRQTLTRGVPQNKPTSLNHVISDQRQFHERNRGFSASTLSHEWAQVQYLHVDYPFNSLARTESASKE